MADTQEISVMRVLGTDDLPLDEPTREQMLAQVKAYTDRAQAAGYRVFCPILGLDGRTAEEKDAWRKDAIENRRLSRAPNRLAFKVKQRRRQRTGRNRK